MLQVEIAAQSLDRFDAVLDADEYERFRQTLERGRRDLQGRTFWNVNSAARGGGVAEMLAAFLPYFVGAGIETRWAVIEGNEEFFSLTKRLHGLLHGIESPDDPRLDDDDRRIYEDALSAEESEVTRMV